ncbi:MAG: CxxxxCH/CxxCH domain-containing protein [Deltaproteobacteria bacterium]|nr:CxxxxCH/CxxCH domain-containing protein [Deltaproteobacteria bacterium]
MQGPLGLGRTLAVAALCAVLAACQSGQSGSDAGLQGDAAVQDDAAQSDAGGDAPRDLSRCGTGGESCGTCHGSGASPAPPPDTSGSSDPSAITVGSHQVHLAGSTGVAPVACSECHVVPTSVLDPGHCDSPAPAELRFGTLASAKGTYPVWDRTSGTCQGVYCHGATLQGGSNKNPSWTSTTALTCGSCHSASYHGQTGCSCHGSVWSGGQIIDPTKHINGKVDM